jgi:ferric-dicitrate binding protein FerR (iron transport regulator)
MSTPIDKGTKRNGESDAAREHALRALFAHAAPREAPPQTDAAEIRAAVYAEWDAMTSPRIIWRRLGFGAAAAALLAAVARLAIATRPPVQLPTVARVERLQGAVLVSVDGGPGVALRNGDPVAADSALTTGAGEVALRLVQGGSLRLAPRTRLLLTAANAADLSTGALYFDSEQRTTGAERFSVVTSHGTLRDVGTQFVVQVDNASLEVSVRDGSVSLARGPDAFAAGAGEKLLAADNANEVHRESIATFGADWAWVERLAPPFDINGRHLNEFLQWVASQTGRTLVFADAATERIARDTVLNGSIDLEPLPKLVAVLALTDLDYSMDGGRLVITVRAVQP